MKEQVSAQDPKTKFSAQRRFICPRGTEDRDKGQRQGKRKKEKGARERGQKYLSQKDKGLSLDKEETDMAHRKMAVYKGTRAHPGLR